MSAWMHHHVVQCRIYAFSFANLHMSLTQEAIRVGFVQVVRTE